MSTSNHAVQRRPSAEGPLGWSSSPAPDTRNDSGRPPPQNATEDASRAAPPNPSQSSTFFRSCEISLMEPVGSMSISPANRDVVLAARKGLFILDLEDPYVPPRFLAHMTTWEAVDIQWNPHPARSNWVASTSNQKLLVWNLDRPGDPRAAPPITRAPLPSSYTMASSSPLASRIGAHQSVFASARSANSGTAASTGLGHLSTHSPFGMTAGHSSTASHFGIAAPRSSAIEHILHAHTRAITDINWSAFHPEVLASCSLDTWTWVWDLRMSGAGDGGRRKPAQGYSAWNAAVAQVKFNRASEHRLASTCDNKVLIWDDRKGSLPLATIEAHESKIYSIDWSRDTSLGLDRLLTCSLDRTVKFWDLSSESAQSAIGARELITEAESVIETKTPVWRARHLPFGNGVMTLPQRGDTSLSMWAKDRPEAPMATFEGHTDIVKEYLFRIKGGQNRDCDDRQFQLLTWSKDQTLRLWPVSEEQTRAVGHKPGAPIRVLNTRAYAPDISYRDPSRFDAIAAEDPVLSGKELGSNSSVTLSSILPPERATRSLLSGKGSGSRINGPSPYSSSYSGFQGGLRDGRGSPVAAFSSSFSQRAHDRPLYHSSSHGSLGADLAAARRQAEVLPRSLGRTDQYSRSATQHQQASKPGPSHSSAKLATSHRSGGSFPLPHGLREGTVARAPAGMGGRKGRPARSHAIREEDEEGGKRAKGQDRSAAAAAGEERDKAAGRVAAERRGKRTSRRALGAPMRLDRARMAGPAVDPIGWIASVRIQKDSGDDGNRVSDETDRGRGAGVERSGRASGTGTGTGTGTGASAGETDREEGLSSQRLGDEIVALSRKLPRILFEKVEVAQKTCTLSMYGPWADREPAFLRITIVFPARYPRRAPTFDLERSANVTLKTRAYLLRGLARLATQAAELDRPSIEVCCRFLLGEPVELLDEDEGEGGNASQRAMSTGTLTDSDDEVGPMRPRMKMPARRMGASFGPHGELVVFGQRWSIDGVGGASGGVGGAGSSGRTSSQTTRHDTEREKDLRNSAIRLRSRSKSRARGGGGKEATGPATTAGMEESRFLRSYTALSSAMSSLARYSKEGSGAGAEHGLRDSDVVQLMSSDFFARRLVSRGGARRASQDTSASGDERRGPLGGMTPLTSTAGEGGQASGEERGRGRGGGGERGSDAGVRGSTPVQAVDRLHVRGRAGAVVRIYYPFVGEAVRSPSFGTVGRGAQTKAPRFVRKRSSSLPLSSSSTRVSSPLAAEVGADATGRGGGRVVGTGGMAGQEARLDDGVRRAQSSSTRTARFTGVGTRDDLHLP